MLQANVNVKPGQILSGVIGQGGQTGWTYSQNGLYPSNTNICSGGGSGGSGWSNGGNGGKANCPNTFNDSGGGGGGGGSTSLAVSESLAYQNPGDGITLFQIAGGGGGGGSNNAARGNNGNTDSNGNIVAQQFGQNADCGVIGTSNAANGHDFQGDGGGGGGGGGGYINGTGGPGAADSPGVGTSPQGGSSGISCFSSNSIVDQASVIQTSQGGSNGSPGRTAVDTSPLPSTNPNSKGSDGSVTITPTFVANPHLSLGKSAALANGTFLADSDGHASGTRVKLNDQIVYTYTVENDGNVPISNVTVTDNHQAYGTTPVIGNKSLLIPNSGQSSDNSPSSNVYGLLAPGDTVTFTSSYTVVQKDVDKLSP